MSWLSVGIHSGKSAPEETLGKGMLELSILHADVFLDVSEYFRHSGLSD